MSQRNFISSLIENLFWLLPLVITLALFNYIYTILLILTIGYIIYLILDPLVCRLERIIRIRFFSVLIIFSIFIAPIYYGISSLVSLISNEYENMYELVTDKNEEITFQKLTDLVKPKIIAIAPDNYQDSIDNFFNDLNSDEKKESVQTWGETFFNFQNTVYIFSWIVNILMYFLIIIAFSLTLLLSAQKFKKSFIQLVPNRYFEMSLKIIDRISEQVSSYVRGTLTAALIVGALSILGLNILCSVTGMQHDYIIIVGIIAGVFNLIPFIGPMIGGVAAILFFLISGQPADFDLQYYHILFIMLTFASVQLIDNFISSPLIISDSVGLHPMFVIIVVMIGGTILGPPGMIISVPIAATLKVIIEELIWGFKNYRYL